MPPASPNTVKHPIFLFFFKKLYLFMAALGLCCFVRAFSSCSERGWVVDGLQ